jgi:hypothetical protein
MAFASLATAAKMCSPVAIDLKDNAEKKIASQLTRAAISGLPVSISAKKKRPRLPY